MFIFTWLWPQLYYLFCVFSIVNIYKTLNKLSEIAFYNLPLPVHQGWELLREEAQCITMSQCLDSLPRTDKGPWFSDLFLFFSLPKSPEDLETYKGTPELSGGTVGLSALYF